MTARLLLSLLCCTALSACGVTVLRDLGYDSGQEISRANRSELEGRPDKASVLEALGPPGEVLPLFEGDVFVYRMRKVDATVWQLNAGLFSPVPVPLYGHLEGVRVDDEVFVFFDQRGQVRHVATARAGRR